MTVKATLAYGRGFHFYHEATDNNHVYLELEDAAYDAGYRRIMVAIPIDVWEVVRGLGAANLELVNASDEDLINLVERRVDERVAEHEEARASAPERAGWLMYSDSAVFGSSAEPRDKQIARGFEYYKTERARQREVAVRISQHKIMNLGTDHPE